MNNIITLDDISLKINNNILLNNINLVVNTKKTTLITGHNGAGKTSLLKILGKIVSPTRGIVNYGNDYKLKKTAFSFQEPIFLNRSVGSNIEHALTCYNGRYSHRYKYLINEILSEFNIIKLKNKLANNLSTGEKKIVSYIRCAVLNPHIIFLDEPYAHLDDRYAKLISEHIFTLSKKTKVFIVTHESSSYRDEDFHIIRMNKGSIV